VTDTRSGRCHGEYVTLAHPSESRRGCDLARSGQRYRKGVTSRVADASAGNLNSMRMEWVLQIADELDDALAVARHTWFGLAADIGVRRPVNFSRRSLRMRG
jgi:hypothetical protein